MKDFEGYAIVPEDDAKGFVELSRSPQGRVFRKKILHYGDLYYPGAGKVVIDEAFADNLIENFKNNVVDTVQVPKADANNAHTDDPDRNLGEVIDVMKFADGVYVDMDIREDADKINKTLLGTSAMLHLNYTDTRTQKKVGPTLLHNCVTNRPYVIGLGDFEEVLSMSVDTTDQNEIVVLTSAPSTSKETEMTLDELLSTLKSDHGIDVPELQRVASEHADAVALTNMIRETLVSTDLISLSATDEFTVDAAKTAIVDAGEKIVSLTAEIDTMREADAVKDATNHVENLVLTGYILPKDKDAMLELRLSNTEIFDKLVPEKPVVEVSLSRGDENNDAQDATVADEVARLSAKAEAQ